MCKMEIKDGGVDSAYRNLLNKKGKNKSAKENKYKNTNLKLYPENFS